MDNKKKFYLLGGVSISLAAGALFAYFTQKQKQLELIIGYLIIQIDLYKFVKALEEKDVFIEILQDSFAKAVNENQLIVELEQEEFLQNLNQEGKKDYYKQLLNFNYIMTYLTSCSLDVVFAKIQEVTKEYKELPSYQFEPKPEELGAIKFFYLNFLYFAQRAEEILVDPENKTKLVHLNFYISLLLDWMNDLIARMPKAAHLFSIALLLPANAWFNEHGVQFVSQTQDYCSGVDLSKCEPAQCPMKLIDFIFRFSSLMTPTLQRKLVALLIEYKVFQTTEQLQEITRLVLKNSFYLGSQLQQGSMYYIKDISDFSLLLFQGTARQQVIDFGAKSEEQQNEWLLSLDTCFLYIERVLNQNKPEFWQKKYQFNQFRTLILQSLIQLHCGIYPLFNNKETIKVMLKDEKRIQANFIHFIGILLIFELRETFEYKGQNDNSELMDWIAKNMNNMLATEVLSCLQLPYLRILIDHVLANSLQKDEAKKDLGKMFLQCLRVVQNNRIKHKQEGKRVVDINVSLTRAFGYFILSLKPQSSSRNSLKQLLRLIPFLDKREKTNIFSNVLRILFDLPSMNLNFLKYISNRCQEISESCQASFNGYYMHIISSQTLSYDQFLFTIQLGFLFGKPDTLLKEIIVRIQRDISQFETYQDFLRRDVEIQQKKIIFQIILLIEVLENEISFMNIMNFLGFIKDDESLEKKWIQLQQKVTIAILQLNQEQLQYTSLIETLKSFINVSNMQSYDNINQLINSENENSPIKLKPEYKLYQPISAIQKDMDSAAYYHTIIEERSEKGEDIQLFDELLNSVNELQYLKDLRIKLYLNQEFQQILAGCLLIVPKIRQALYPWLGKLAFYGFQALTNINLIKGEKRILKRTVQVQSLKEILLSQNMSDFIIQLTAIRHCKSLANHLIENSNKLRLK